MTETTIHGIRYKIGRHGYVYRWADHLGEWVRSTKQPHELGVLQERIAARSQRRPGARVENNGRRGA